MGHHVIAEADIARVAMFASMTGKAAVAVVRKNDREDGLAAFLHLIRLCPHDHVVLHDCGTRQLKARRPLDIDEARAAACVRLETVDIAEARNVNPVVLEYFHQGCARWRLNDLAVDGE
jgi:hypothetical protein